MRVVGPSPGASALIAVCALGIGCTSATPAEKAYETCVNAEAEARFEAAAEACRSAAELDPTGKVGGMAQKKLAAIAPHLAPKPSAAPASSAAAPAP
jgi:hypothetical protein